MGAPENTWRNPTTQNETTLSYFVALSDKTKRVKCGIHSTVEACAVVVANIDVPSEIVSLSLLPEENDTMKNFRPSSV